MTGVDVPLLGPDPDPQHSYSNVLSRFCACDARLSSPRTCNPHRSPDTFLGRLSEVPCSFRVFRQQGFSAGNPQLQVFKERALLYRNPRFRSTLRRRFPRRVNLTVPPPDSYGIFKEKQTSGPAILLAHPAPRPYPRTRVTGPWTTRAGGRMRGTDLAGINPSGRIKLRSVCPVSGSIGDVPPLPKTSLSP
jgi:hypothetical protein